MPWSHIAFFLFCNWLQITASALSVSGPECRWESALGWGRGRVIGSREQNITKGENSKPKLPREFKENREVRGPGEKRNILVNRQSKWGTPVALDANKKQMCLQRRPPAPLSPVLTRQNSTPNHKRAGAEEGDLSRSSCNNKSKKVEPGNF